MDAPLERRKIRYFLWFHTDIWCHLREKEKEKIISVISHRYMDVPWLMQILIHTTVFFGMHMYKSTYTVHTRPIHYRLSSWIYHSHRTVDWSCWGNAIWLFTMVHTGFREWNQLCLFLATQCNMEFFFPLSYFLYV
jgi:hypothetical protein